MLELVVELLKSAFCQSCFVSSSFTAVFVFLASSDLIVALMNRRRGQSGIGEETVDDEVLRVDVEALVVAVHEALFARLVPKLVEQLVVVFLALGRLDHSV